MQKKVASEILNKKSDKENVVSNAHVTRLRLTVADTSKVDVAIRIKRCMGPVLGVVGY